MAVMKRDDDFVIVNLSGRSATDGAPVENYVVTGPGIDGWTMRFSDKAEAETKGRELAKTAGVSLWCEPDSRRNEGVLVETYRAPSNRDSAE